MVTYTQLGAVKKRPWKLPGSRVSEGEELGVVTYTQLGSVKKRPWKLPGSRGSKRRSFSGKYAYRQLGAVK